jgi:hypothetical protein
MDGQRDHPTRAEPAEGAIAVAVLAESEET